MLKFPTFKQTNKQTSKQKPGMVPEALETSLFHLVSSRVVVVLSNQRKFPWLTSVFTWQGTIKRARVPVICWYVPWRNNGQSVTVHGGRGFNPICDIMSREEGRWVFSPRNCQRKFRFQWTGICCGCLLKLKLNSVHFTVTDVSDPKISHLFNEIT